MNTFPGRLPRRTYKYYDLLMAGFVTVLLCSDIIGVQKVCTIGGISFGAGILFFPLSYAFGDVLTEVYGYARSRKVIWAGFGALIFAAFMSWVIVRLPAERTWRGQEAYEAIFGQTPRIIFASLTAFWAGEFANPSPGQAEDPDEWEVAMDSDHWFYSCG